MQVLHKETIKTLKTIYLPKLIDDLSQIETGKFKDINHLTVYIDEVIDLLSILKSDDEKTDEKQGSSNKKDIKTEEIEEIPEWEDNDLANDKEMVNDFIVNADELMDSLNDSILNLEQDPNNKDNIEEIFRTAHTLKGASGMFGFKAIERIVHKMENLFDLIRKDKLHASSDIIDIVFKAQDILKILINAVKKQEPSGIKTSEIVNILYQATKGNIVKEKISKKETNLQKTNNTTKTPEQLTIRVGLKRLDSLVNLIGELVIDRTRFHSIEDEIRNRHPNLNISANLTETVQLFSRHMNEIQDIIMKIRMVPIGQVFKKFNRIIRDLSRSLNKQIELKIFGENTELDKTIVEQISDPLIHLIRNACDHGIENLDERQKQNKNKTGYVELSAKQEGNHVIVTIKDDGKGLDPEIIKNKSIQKGIISSDDNLTESEIFALIFESGFSTAKEVTNISGRGVGMDAVKKQIAKLNGMISIQSKKGKGTTISIQLPLTLAIMQSLLINANDDIFAIPLNSVVESVRVDPQNIKKIGNTKAINIRDKILPLMYLDDVLDLRQKKTNFWYDVSNIKKITNNTKNYYKTKANKLFIVVVDGTSHQKFGIVVDNLLNQQEMVIKSMGKVMTNIPCITGGSVLGNGKIVLVLDISELEKQFKIMQNNPNL